MCAAGNFLNITIGSCAPCGYGYYQPDTGRTYCLVCASGKTTSSQTATDKTQCFDQCPSGSQLTLVGDCVICEIGTYRKKGKQAVCTPCESGRTTPGEGGKGKEACSLVICPAGKYRVGEDPGKCHDCPLGSYRNQSMDNCTSCGVPATWRTDGEGKTSKDECKFYCPAGWYIKPDAHGEKRCEGCPKNSYKPKDKYYAVKCDPCPNDKPRTAGVNSTAISDCRLGKCKRSSMFHVMVAMLVALRQDVVRIG
ncbi:hypothetical protein NP493_241g05033 [Ridgeia piscesae]|uniref:Tyrosine-protein kinase ephrin type A/B receptor-like domain-containing protein n=1 Tax=Ridgeia piscesae TaxID=27915 RepID=A0AAD9UDE7_RIDPI|nr:hypothetical protein NP493_241g05033 [Ridgeia piscesae]